MIYYKSYVFNVEDIVEENSILFQYAQYDLL